MPSVDCLRLLISLFACMCVGALVPKLLNSQLPAIERDLESPQSKRQRQDKQNHAKSAGDGNHIQRDGGSVVNHHHGDSENGGVSQLPPCPLLPSFPGILLRRRIQN
jgi:hypothetical protein